MLALFARINTAPTFGFKPLGDFGLTSGTNPTVFLNEYSYKKGTKIYGEKEPATYVYQVKIGAVRSYKLLSDGRRLIGAFHLVGDIFGSTGGENHRFTAEAVVDTTLRLIKPQSLDLAAKEDAYSAVHPREQRCCSEPTSDANTVLRRASHEKSPPWQQSIIASSS